MGFLGTAWHGFFICLDNHMYKYMGGFSWNPGYRNTKKLAWVFLELLDMVSLFV